MASGPITSWQIDEETMETEKLFFGAPKSLQMVTAAMKLRCLFRGRKAMTKLDDIYGTPTSISVRLKQWLKTNFQVYFTE